MELLGGISAGEWSSLNGIYDHHDQLIMASDHDHDHYNFPSHEYAVPNYDMGVSIFGLPFTILPNGNDSTIIHDMPGKYYNHDVSKFCDYNYHPAETMVTSNIVFCEARNNAKLLHDIEGDHDNNDQWLNINQEVSNAGEESGGSQTSAAYLVPQLKWEPDMMITVPEQSNMENASLSENISKKRSRSTTTDNQDNPKNKRNVKSRKGKKCALSDDEEEGSAGSGEKYSDASHEELGGMASSPSPSPSPSPRGPAALNLNGKTRASRGSATDPQSVYARKRREKINERLRILQNLVPNGTKVDISTMLEEAVQYVKFLQLQIKLLSSDDLWMYAPLAYNGMDIGLDHLRLAAPRQ